jgi:hypothetical protein
MDKLNQLLNNLKKLDREFKSTKIYIKPDEEGYIEKECPDRSCLFMFKVHLDDWESKFNSESVHCPKCNQISPSNTYFPSKLITSVKNQIIRHTRERLFKSRPFPRELIPYKTSAPWELKIECEKCDTRFSVIGGAFYCPCCGYNSIETYFEYSMNKVSIKISDLDSLIKPISDSIGIDKASIIIQSMKETSLTDIVVSFQHYCNLIHTRITGKIAKQNIFQKVNEGSKLWEKIFGSGYHDWITNSEYILMVKLFQQRHLFQHTDGVVDQNYIDKSGDNSYKIGQRIKVQVSEIEELVKIIVKISNNLKKYGA